MEQKKKIRIAIIALSVLLAISLAALGKTLLTNKQADRAAATVTVPDNLITPGEVAAVTDSVERGNANTTEHTGSTGHAGSSTSAPTTGTAASTTKRKATSIELYDKRPEDNEAFQVGNMFPGDAETEYYCVRVSYRSRITVHFKASARPGYEKLAEVLRIRVKLLTTGETLYDGPIGSMSDDVTHKLTARGAASDDLYYEITAYLDTSVGNEYQNKDLIADFRWWVEEKEQGNLEPSSPKTGDTAQVLLWTASAAASACVIVCLLAARRRKEGDANG